MNPNPGGDLEIFAKKINGKATLEELTGRVCEAHKAAQGAAANALAAIFAAGEALIAARPRLAAGSWQRWLRTNCFRGALAAGDAARPRLSPKPSALDASRGA
jgi:hypothetical protein